MPKLTAVASTSVGDVGDYLDCQCWWDIKCGIELEYHMPHSSALLPTFSTETLQCYMQTDDTQSWNADVISGPYLNGLPYHTQAPPATARYVNPNVLTTHTTNVRCQ